MLDLEHDFDIVNKKRLVSIKIFGLFDKPWCSDKMWLLKKSALNVSVRKQQQTKYQMLWWEMVSVTTTLTSKPVILTVATVVEPVSIPSIVKSVNV